MNHLKANDELKQGVNCKFVIDLSCTTFKLSDVRCIILTNTGIILAKIDGSFRFCLICLFFRLYVLVNNFSVILGWLPGFNQYFLSNWDEVSSLRPRVRIGSVRALSE